MKYELTIFEDIISGELSPLSVFKSRDEYLSLLWEINTDFYSIVYATLKKDKHNRYSLINKKSINGLNPYAKDFADRQIDLFVETKLDDYKKVLESLNINPDSVIKTGFYQQPKKYLLMIKHRVDIADVSYQELKYYYYSALLKNEFTRLVTTIRDTVFSFKSAEKIHNYIHKLQQAFVSLSYRLIKLINPKTHGDLYREPLEFSDIEILRMTYASVEELQKFLEKNFFNYLDRSVPVPYRSSLIKMYDLVNKLNIVKTALFKAELEQDLLKIVYAPLLKLSTEAIHERVSYKDLIYTNAYLTAFYDKVKENDYSISSNEVIRLLFVVNFNDLGFVNQQLALYRNSTETLGSLHDKIDYLYKQLKYVNQRPSNLSITYNAQLSSLKDQLTGWLEEEISYLSKKARLFARPDAPGMFYEGETLKLQSGLSVAQLSFFYKLQSEVGIISHKTQKDIFKHVAESYKTSKAMSISPDSVGSKFYNVDTSTVETVKSKVIEMLNYIREFSVP